MEEISRDAPLQVHDETFVDLVDDGRSGPVVERDLRAKLKRTERLLARASKDQSETNHRIANSLQVVVSFLKMQRRKIADEGASQALADAEARIMGIAQLHRYIAFHDGDGQVELADFLQSLCCELSVSTGLACSVTAQEVRTTQATANRVAIIVNELVMNARKHAYDDASDGPVRITGTTMVIASKRLLSIVVADDGRGLPDGFATGLTTGLGRAIIASAVAELRGTLQAENDGGARFTLTLPLG